jgi:O-antigen/teichoic acid export membrane protein
MAEQSYFDGHRVIPFVVLSSFLYGFQRWFQLVLALHKRTLLIMLSVLSGGLMNVILNLIAVPMWGYQAAAVNNLIGYLVFTILIVYFSRKLMIWRFPYSSMVRALLASVPVWLTVVFVMRLDMPALIEIMICASVGCMVYALSLLVLGEASFVEIRKAVRSLLSVKPADPQCPSEDGKESCSLTREE